jgi:hypothetical protein
MDYLKKIFRGKETTETPIHVFHIQNKKCQGDEKL